MNRKTDGWTDVRMDGWMDIYGTSSPSVPLPKKWEKEREGQKEREKYEERKQNRTVLLQTSIEVGMFT